MDESSRINRELYWDVKQFAEGYIHSSGPKKNNNYWWTHSRAGGMVGPFNNDRGRFPELHVDSTGMISDFEFVLYPYLVAREEMLKVVDNPFLNEQPNVQNMVYRFKSIMDSLVIIHKTLYEYVNNKSYLNDSGFTKALDIIDRTSLILDEYHFTAYHLSFQINDYFMASLKPLNTQKKILAAEIEMFSIMEVLFNWEGYLYAGDQSHNLELDSAVHQFNDAGLAKDSIYLYGTYGYGISNNGAMPHTRYRIFYNMMKSTLYWYVKDKYGFPDYMKKSDVYYNEFVDRTHMVIEDFNDFRECADGKKLSENMDYSMKMAAQVGVDTNQNVLLQFPRWGYVFHFVKPEDKITVVQKTDTITSVHQQLITKASPHHMVFLLDVSASMNNPGKMDILKDGTKYLVGLQRKSDHLSLLTFSTHSHTLLRNVSCDQKEMINSKIDELQTHGATNASDGIRNAFGVADTNKISDGKNKIVLVTDGKFQLDTDASKLLGGFKKKTLELVILLISTEEDPILDKAFEKMAKKGNGRYYKVNTNNLEEVLIKEASD